MSRMGKVGLGGKRFPPRTPRGAMNRLAPGAGPVRRRLRSQLPAAAGNAPIISARSEDCSRQADWLLSAASGTPAPAERRHRSPAPLPRRESLTGEPAAPTLAGMPVNSSRHEHDGRLPPTRRTACGRARRLHGAMNKTRSLEQHRIPPRFVAPAMAGTGWRIRPVGSH